MLVNSFVAYLLIEDEPQIHCPIAAADSQPLKRLLEVGCVFIGDERDIQGQDYFCHQGHHRVGTIILLVNIFVAHLFIEDDVENARVDTCSGYTEVRATPFGCG